MRIAVSGSTGLIGSALVSALEADGHSIIPIVCSGRMAPSGVVSLDPKALAPGVEGLFTFRSPYEMRLNRSWVRDFYHPELEGIDAVVHLAGENIAKGRWTRDRKLRILSSRVSTTMGLCKALSQLKLPPRALLIASAVGIYGNRGDEQLDEGSVPEPAVESPASCASGVRADDGNENSALPLEEEVVEEFDEEVVSLLSDESGASFLAVVCALWEVSKDEFPLAWTRTASLRFGAVLSGKGGALAKMLPPFRWGLGGVIGSGEQYMSWIEIDDVVGAIKHVLAAETLQGPVNVVSPNPVTNREFTKTLGRVLRRPTLFPIPAFAVRLAFGELADALLLSSQRVVPRKLMDSGYVFKYPVLEDALRHVLDLK